MDLILEGKSFPSQLLSCDEVFLSFIFGLIKVICAAICTTNYKQKFVFSLLCITVPHKGGHVTVQKFLSLFTQKINLQRFWHRQFKADIEFPPTLPWFLLNTTEDQIKLFHCQKYASHAVQLNKYETAPYIFLLNQNLTWDCLLISLVLPEFD